MIVLSLLFIMIFKALTSRSKSSVSLLAIFILALFSREIASVTYSLYAKLDQLIFFSNQSGATTFAIIPMKIPDGMKNAQTYCAQFKNQDGSSVSDYFIDENHNAYCGNSYYHPDPHYFYPFKKLENGDVVYWTAPEKRIICTTPCLVDITKK